MPVRIMLTRFTPSYVVLLKCKIEGFNIMSLFGSAMGCCNLHSQILCLQGLRNTNKRFSHSNLQLGQKSIGCGRNSELIINENNNLLEVIDTDFSTSQITMVHNFFFFFTQFHFLCTMSFRWSPPSSVHRCTRVKKVHITA